MHHLCLSKNEIKFLLIICLLSSLFYLLFFPGNSYYSDQDQYLTLGNDILNGRYSLGVFHRGPALPVFVSLSMLAGIGPKEILVLLPLIFTNLLIIVTFIFSKMMIGNGYFSTLIMVTLPYFWRWTVRLLVESLLTVFILISILLFVNVVL